MMITNDNLLHILLLSFFQYVHVGVHNDP
jgi:hypothetical protein